MFPGSGRGLRSLGGPVDATIYATSTRPDTEWVATLEDVAPDGTATPITTGALLGSLRSTDSSRSWTEPDGRMILGHHPYTAGSKQPVPAGTVTRFDVEIRPTFAELAAGHRLRLTLTSSDLPTLIPTEADATNLIGGVYQVQRNRAAASYLEVLSAPASAVTGATTTCARGRARFRASGPARRARPCPLR